MKSPEKIKNMFNEIAQKYDFMNNLMSFGLHKFVKKSAINKLILPYRAKVLDLCCGTGDITKLMAKKKEVEMVKGVDFSSNMLNIANKKNVYKKITYINVDCTNLSFEKDLFDCVTMFFGLRNIENTDCVLKEIERVLKRNGQFLYMDFSKENEMLNKIFDFFTLLFASIFCPQNKSAYEYLIKSKNEFYSSEELQKILEPYNLKLKKEYNFLFGIIFAQVYEKN